MHKIATIVAYVGLRVKSTCYCVFTIFFSTFINLTLDKQLQAKKSNNETSSSTSKQTLESGSAVELGKPPVQYGVIKWIRSIGGDDQAYVEMVRKYDTYVHYR